MAMNGVGCRATARIMGVSLNTILRHLKKLRPQSVTSRIQPGSSKSVELHDKVIGHYLNIKHYQ
ncbi:Transposase [Shigella dysenteriae 1617]|uniref:Transposase n=1 Tax=Shigella dysenteriae 1617 TaxID=754093 RepID=A0A0A6ZYB6_SHIDY|nr:Transposase [Shigella dysenteriae 1617]